MMKSGAKEKKSRENSTLTFREKGTRRRHVYKVYIHAMQQPSRSETCCHALGASHGASHKYYMQTATYFSSNAVFFFFFVSSYIRGRCL